MDLANVLISNFFYLPCKHLSVQIQHRNTRKRYEMCLKLTIKNTRTTRYQVYFTLTSKASIVDFEQVNICRDCLFLNVKWLQLYFKFSTEDNKTYKTRCFYLLIFYFFPLIFSFSHLLASYNVAEVSWYMWRVVPKA